MPGNSPVALQWQRAIRLLRSASKSALSRRPHLHPSPIASGGLIVFQGGDWGRRPNEVREAGEMPGMANSRGRQGVGPGVLPFPTSLVPLLKSSG
jgi:hypothetical protein